jgi:hypothetical protein
VAADIRTVAQLGLPAAEASIGIGALKFFGCITGMAGGMVNYVASMQKTDDQSAVGNADAAFAYRISAVASLGTAFTSAGLAAGTLASTSEERAIGGAVVRTVATRLAANAVIGTVGGIGLTISGIGLVLLGAGVVFQIGAIALTPTDIQRWLGRSYFGRDGGIIFSGKRHDMFPKGDWSAERDEFNGVLKKAAQAQADLEKGKAN